MPSMSDKQRMMMAIAEHHPEELYAKNKGVLKMGHKKLHEFASGVVNEAVKKEKKKYG